MIIKVKQLIFLKIRNIQKFMDSSKNSQSISNLLSNIHTNQNSLAKRLYKNYSQSKLDNKSLIPPGLSSIDISHQTSLLQRTSDDNSLLVPRITLKNRYKQINIEKPLQILNGKFIVHSNNTSSMMETNSNKKHMFTKLQKLQYKNLNRILPDSVLQQSSGTDFQSSKLKDMLKKSKGKIYKPSATIKSYSRQPQKEEESEQILTPFDFIKLIKQDPNILDEFCYLKKMSNPYDLRIVDYIHKDPEGLSQTLKNDTMKYDTFNKKSKLRSLNNIINNNKSQCITISARGITYFTKQDSTFVSLEEWEREAGLYNKLVNLNFFKKYKIWKNFFSWKKYIRRTAMKKVTEKLKNELLFTDKHIRPTLIYARDLTFMIQNNVKYFKIDQSQKQIKNCEEFKCQQQIYRATQLDSNLNVLEDQIKKTVIQSCRHSLKSFKEENRIANSEDRGDEEQKPPLLIGDETNKQMPYTQEATIKTHYKKLNKFIKLIDFMIVAGKINMLMESTAFLRQKISEKNIDYLNQVIKTNQKYSYKGKQWFSCSISFGNVKNLIYEPSCSRLKLIFEEIVTKGIHRVCKKHKSISESHELQIYYVQKQEEEEKAQEPYDLQTILYSQEKFKMLYKQLLKEVDISFTYVQRYSERLNEFLNIYFCNINQNMNLYQTKDHEILQKSIERWKAENSKLNSIIQEHEAGLILIKLDNFKNKIKNCAQYCLQQMYRIIPEMLKTQTNELINNLTSYREQIDNKPQNVEEFISFYQNVNIITHELDNLSAKLFEISFLNIIIKNNKNSMNESMQGLKNKEKRVTEAQSSLTILRNKIDQANMNFNSSQVFFQEEVKQMIPQENRKIQNFIKKIKNYDLNLESKIPEAVDFLEEKCLELKNLFEWSQRLMFYQKSLQMQETNHDNLRNLKDYFDKILKLWRLKLHFKKFYERIIVKQFRKIDIETEYQNFCKIQIQIESLIKQIKIQEKQSKQEENFAFTDNDKLIVLKFYQTIKVFHPIIITLRILNDQILKEKEWIEIRNYLSVHIKEPEIFTHLDSPLYTTEYIQTKEIYKFCDYFSQIATKAKKQAELDLMLKNVSSFWINNVIQYVPYKDYKDAFILASNNELYSKIDECLIELNFIFNSKYFDTVMVQAKRQKKLFNNLQEILSQWKKYEKYWLFLEPIFTNSHYKSFIKQLKLFTVADNSWRKIMKISKDFSAKKWAESENILQTIKSNNILFESLFKLIGEFLEKKREIFHRFYFVSDQQLIKIISESKDIRLLQPHLRQVFQCVEKFDFNSVDKETQRNQIPTGLVNFDNEILQLKALRIGNQPEEWLKNLEQCMKASVRTTIKSCLASFEKDNFVRKKWIKEHIFQAIHLVDMIQWTKITQNDYLSPESEGDINDLYTLQLFQLNETIQILNQQTSNVKKTLLHSLLIQDIQNRDIIQMLKNQLVQSYTDFKWQQQFRAYATNETFLIKQFQSQITYGYQFLTSKQRIFVTAQTQKCRIKLMQAISNGYPSILNHEYSNDFVKDLSHLCGKKLIEYNCMLTSVSFVQKVLQGASSTGSWVILKNLNRNQDKFSIIFHYIEMIRVALQNKENFYFRNGKNINLNKESGIFLIQSVNPKSQISEQHRSHFRSTNICSPDQSYLLQINLYKFGFMTISRDFSKQLIILIHYFNEIFQNIKPLSVQIIISKVIKKMKITQSKFDENVFADHLIFHLKEFFKHYYQISIEVVHKYFNEIFGNKGMMISQSSKFIQIQENSFKKIVQKNNLIVLIGKSYTSAIDLITNTLLNNKQIKLEESILKISTSIFSVQQILGKAINTYDWINGMLPDFIKVSNGPKWIVFEQPTQLFLQYLLHSSRDEYFQLPNGNKIPITQSIKIFVKYSNRESIKLQLNENSYIYEIDPIRDIQFLIKRLAILNTKQHSHIITYLIQVCKQSYQKIISSVTKNLQEYLEKVETQYIGISFCQNVKAFLKTQKIQNINQRGIEKLFAWCLQWSLFSLLKKKKGCYQKFCKLFYEALKLQHIKIINLVQYALIFQIPQGSFKPFTQNSDDTPKQLVPYTQHIKMHCDANNSLLILGKTGNLKSQTMNQLQVFEPEQKLIIFTLQSKTNLNDLKSFLKNLLTIRRKNNEVILQPVGYNSESKINIFVDNANLNIQIMQFISDFTQKRYRYLWIQQQRKMIFVSTNLVIHSIVNGKIQQVFLDKNLHFIYFNTQGEQILNDIYKAKFLQKIEQNTFNYLFEKTKEYYNRKKTQNPKKYNNHYLSKLYQHLIFQNVCDESSWIKEFIRIQSYQKDNMEAKQKIKEEILVAFEKTQEIISNISYEHVLSRNLIRIYKEDDKIQSTFQYLRTKIINTDGLVQFKNKEYIAEKLKQSKDLKKICIYLFQKNSSEFESKFQYVCKLIHKNGGTNQLEIFFIVDVCSQRIFQQKYYKKFNSFIDKYFLVAYIKREQCMQDQLSCQKLMKTLPNPQFLQKITNANNKIRQFIKDDHYQNYLLQLTKHYVRIYQTRLRQIGEEKNILKKGLEKYIEIKKNDVEGKQKLLQKKNQFTQNIKDEQNLIDRLKSQSLKVSHLKKELSESKQSLKDHEDDINNTDQNAITQNNKAIQKIEKQLYAFSKKVALTEQNLLDNNKKKENIQNELKKYEQKIKIIQVIQTFLSSYNEKWMQKYQKLVQFQKNQLENQSLLYALTITYLLNYPQSQRLQILFNTLNLSNIKLDSSDILKYIQTKHIRIYDPENRLQKMIKSAVIYTQNIEKLIKNEIIIYQQLIIQPNILSQILSDFVNNRIYLIEQQKTKKSFNLMQEDITQQLKQLIIQIINKDKKDEYCLLKTQIAEYNTFSTKKENQMLNVLNTLTLKISEDDKIICQVNKINGEIYVNLENLKYIQNSKSELQLAIYSPYQPLTQQLLNIYQLMNKLNRINSKYTYSFLYFKKLIKNAVLDGIIPNLPLEQSIAKITQYIYYHLLISMEPEHQPILKMYFSLLIHKVDTKTIDTVCWPVQTKQSQINKILKQFTQRQLNEQRISITHEDLQRIIALSSDVNKQMELQDEIQKISLVLRKYQTLYHWIRYWPFVVIDNRYNIQDILFKLFKISKAENVEFYRTEYLVQFNQYIQKVLEETIRSNGWLVLSLSKTVDPSCFYKLNQKIQKLTFEISQPYKFKIFFIGNSCSQQIPYKILSNYQKISLHYGKKQDIKSQILNFYCSLSKELSDYDSLTPSTRKLLINLTLYFSILRYHYNEHNLTDFDILNIFNMIKDMITNSNTDWQMIRQLSFYNSIKQKIIQNKNLRIYELLYVKFVDEDILSENHENNPIYQNVSKLNLEQLVQYIQKHFTNAQIQNIYTLEEYVSNITPVPIGLHNNFQKIYGNSTSIKGRVQIFKDEIVEKKLLKIINQLKQYPLIKAQYGGCQLESIQECIKNQARSYNKFIAYLKYYLETLRVIIRKNEILDPMTSQTIQQIYADKIPENWKILSFNTQKALPEFFEALLLKGNYLKSLEALNFKPKVYAISLFMSPKKVLNRLIILQRKKQPKLSLSVSFKFITNNLLQTLLLSNESNIILTDLYLSNFKYDIVKNSMQQISEQKKILKSPTILMSLCNQQIQQCIKIPVYESKDRLILKVDILNKKRNENQFLNQISILCENI